jgi:hypothetical protein
MLLALSWPVATLIAAVTGLLAIGLWQTFAVVIRDHRETARVERLRRRP